MAALPGSSRGEADGSAQQLSLAAALAYASRAWPVFPLHTPKGEGCSCGRPKCEHPGKHPRTQHGLLDATRDEATIRQWWARWPDANIGLVTGASSGIVVLDIDPRHGGYETLNHWVRERGPLPDTVEAWTGGGGRHIFFAHPGGHVKSRNLAPGIDVKADGGYIVVPPSLHASGKRYEWGVWPDPVGDSPAPLPSWLLAIVRPSAGEPGGSSVGEAEGIPAGKRNAALTSFAGTMRWKGMSEEAIRAALSAENEQRCDPPLPPDEVWRIAHSVARYHPAYGSDAAQAADTGVEHPGAAPEANNRPLVPSEADAEGDHAIAIPWPGRLARQAFHGLAGDFVRLVDPHTEADPAALLLSFLASFGNAVGRGPYFLAEAAKHYTNLYAVLVGRTAKSRKGSSQAHVQRPLQTVDSDWARDRIQFGLSSGEGLIWAVRAPIQKQQPVREKGRLAGYEEVIEDPGVTDKRLLIIEQEFASTLRVMGRDGNTLSANIRMAWDTGDLQLLTKNSPARATGAHISIIGHVTKDEVLRYLDTTEAGNGFANRFLWACVRRSKLLPDGGQIHDVDFAPFTRRLRTAVEFARGIAEMRRDGEAGRLWHEVYPTLSQDVPGLLGAVIGRAEPQTMRLACIYALLDQLPVVRQEHLEAALAVWRYCEDSARFIFGDALGDPVADAILRALRHADNGLTRTEISSLFRRNVTASRISQALALLQEPGLAVCRTDVAEGGRPAERWQATGPGQRTDSGLTKETNETN